MDSPFNVGDRVIYTDRFRSYGGGRLPGEITDISLRRVSKRFRYTVALDPNPRTRGLDPRNSREVFADEGDIALEDI